MNVSCLPSSCIELFAHCALAPVWWCPRLHSHCAHSHCGLHSPDCSAFTPGECLQDGAAECSSGLSSSSSQACEILAFLPFSF